MPVRAVSAGDSSSPLAVVLLPYPRFVPRLVACLRLQLCGWRQSDSCSVWLCETQVPPLYTGSFDCARKLVMQHGIAQGLFKVSKHLNDALSCWVPTLLYTELINS